MEFINIISKLYVPTPDSLPNSYVLIPSFLASILTFIVEANLLEKISFEITLIKSPI